MESGAKFPEAARPPLPQRPARTAIKPAKSKPRKKSRLWWHVHQWTGFKLAIFLSFIFLTGTLAVLSHEIDWLLQPSARVAPSTVQGEPRWDKIAIAAAAWPDTKEILVINKPVASAFAANVTIRKKDDELTILHIHPTSGVVQGDGGWVGAARVLRNMHRHLNLPLKYGVPIVSSLGFLLLVSFISSFFVYKKWWRGFFKGVRWRDARTAWGDVHRLAGVWSLWFVLLIALTGIWYFAESVGLDAPDAPEAEAVGEYEIANTAAVFPKSLAAARAAFPDLEIERVTFPSKVGVPFEFQGQYKAVLVRERANAVATDPVSGAVLLIRDGRDLTVHQRISEMADPLHFGYFGGYWTKVPWFLFGAVLTLLSVSGVAIYGHRIAKALPAPAGVWTSAWRGMGWWRWLASGLVLTGLVMIYRLFETGG